MIKRGVLKLMWLDKTYKREIIKGELFVCLSAFFSFIQYFSFASLINELKFKLDISSIVIGLVSIALSVGLLYIGKYSLVKVVTDFEYNNRNLLVDKLPLIEILRKGNELSVFFDIVTRGIYNLSSKVQWLIEKWPLIFVEGIVAIIFSAFVDWKLALAYSCCIAIIQCVSFYVGRFYFRKTEIYRNELADHELSICNLIENRENIIGEGYNTLFKNNLLNDSKKLMSYKWKIDIFSQIYWMLGNYSSLVYMIIYYILGGFLIGTGEVSLGILISFNVYSDSIRNLFSSLITYQEANVDCNVELKNLDRISQMKSEKDIVDRISDSAISGKIIVDTLNYMVDNKMIVNNVSFQIQEGEKICIVGQNGAGKSTLGKVLAGIYKEKSGNVWIESDNIRKEREKGDIQYIDQNILFLNETILKNMKYASILENYEDMYTISELIQKKGLNLFVGERLINEFDRSLEEGEGSVSGGEARTLGILRGLLARRKIVIFDEPTEGLDKTRVEAFCDLLNKMEETCIVITHDIQLCEKANYIFVMENGVLVESGTHFELMKNSESYYSLICEENHHG